MSSRRRRSPVALSCLIAACSTLTACGEAPAPKTPTVDVAAGPAVSTAPGGAPQVSAPKEPASLFLVARWKGPVRDAARALEALGVPLSVEALLEKRMANASTLIDYEGSLDVAMSLDPSSAGDDPRVFAGLSLPLRNFDDAVGIAVHEQREVVTVRPGVVRTSNRGGAEECLIVQSAGGPGARLVCARSTRELDTLGEWMARGLGGAPPGTDGLVATLRGARLRERFLTPLRTDANELGEQARAFLAAQNVTDPDLVAAPGIVVDEGIQFLKDVDGAALHLSLASAPPHLDVEGSLRFGARNAWLTQVLVSATEKAGSPPALFWHAPRDTSSATWVRSGDPHLFDGIHRVLRKGLALALERLPIMPPGNEQVIAAFVASAFNAFTPTPTFVVAQGVFPAGKKRPAVSARPTPAETLAEAKRVATRAIGWQLTGLDAPAAEYIAWGKQSVDLYARVVKLIRASIPTHGKVTDEDRRLLGLLPQLTTVTSLPGWPPGTVAFDLQITLDSELAELFTKQRSVPAVKVAPKPGRPAGAEDTITLRIAVVPDGNHTWIGLSADLDELKKHLAATLDSAPREGTLAARDGLSALNDPGQTWGGFFSVGTLIDGTLEMVGGGSHLGAKLNGILAQMPDHGQTPILWGGTGTTGPTPTSALKLRVQAATLADVATLVKLATTPGGEEVLGKMLDKVDRP